jgi:hypothetical protein
MLMWSLIIILVNSGRRSSEGVLLLDPLFENKCLEKSSVTLDSPVFFWFENFSFDVQQNSLISIIFGSIFDSSDCFGTRLSLVNLNYRCNFFSCCSF